MRRRLSSHLDICVMHFDFPLLIFFHFQSICSFAVTCWFGLDTKKYLARFRKDRGSKYNTPLQKSSPALWKLKACRWQTRLSNAITQCSTKWHLVDITHKTALFYAPGNDNGLTRKRESSVFNKTTPTPDTACSPCCCLASITEILAVALPDAEAVPYLRQAARVLHS